jgi:hypothetical protein
VSHLFGPTKFEQMSTLNYIHPAVFRKFTYNLILILYVICEIDLLYCDFNKVTCYKKGEMPNILGHIELSVGLQYYISIRIADENISIDLSIFF